VVQTDQRETLEIKDQKEDEVMLDYQEALEQEKTPKDQTHKVKPLAPLKELHTLDQET